MNYEFYQVCGLRCLFELSRWCMSSIRYGVCAVYLSSQDDLWTLPGIKFALFIRTLKMIYEFYQVWRLRCSFTLSRWSKSIIKYCVFEFAFDIYEVWYLTWHTNFQPNHAPLAEDAFFSVALLTFEVRHSTQFVSILYLSCWKSVGKVNPIRSGVDFMTRVGK